METRKYGVGVGVDVGFDLLRNLQVQTQKTNFYADGKKISRLKISHKIFSGSCKEIKNISAFGRSMKTNS